MPRPTPKVSWVPLAVLLAGCASVSSGVVPGHQPGTWSVTERASPINGGATAAAQVAMDKAAAYCSSEGQRFVPVEAHQFGRPFQQELVGDTGFSLTFRCRSRNPDDRDLQAVTGVAPDTTEP
jgi:hypothetical protein